MPGNHGSPWRSDFFHRERAQRSRCEQVSRVSFIDAGLFGRELCDPEEPAHGGGKDTASDICCLWININGGYEDARDPDSLTAARQQPSQRWHKGHWDSPGHSGEVTVIIE